MEKGTINLKLGDRFRNADEIFDDAVIFKVTNMSEEKDGITCDVYQNGQYLYSQVLGLSETLQSLENGSFVFVKPTINELIEIANDTDREVTKLRNENRSRMVEVITRIVKLHGGVLTGKEMESVLGENCEITFISDDCAYINDFCEVEKISTFEMHDGTPSFTINCDESSDYPEWAMTYENVWDIFAALTDWYLRKEG